MSLSGDSSEDGELEPFSSYYFGDITGDSSSIDDSTIWRAQARCCLTTSSLKKAS